MIVSSKITRALKGEKLAHPPFWFMRQAGRYLPEYRAIRKKTKSFLTLCYTPKLAAEVTLQPIRRFGMDAAIIFSDILVIPHALGQDVKFVEKQGPVLKPITNQSDIKNLTGDVLSNLGVVGEAIALTRKELPPEKSLIGFCGAPWTVACYMIEGRGKSDFSAARIFAHEQEKLFAMLMEKLIDASVSYLCMQVKAGADILQIFDSWAGLLSPQEYEKWVIAPTREIIKRVKAKHADIPIIGFARGSGVLLSSYAEKTGIDVAGIDVQTPMQWAKSNLAIPLQGNLDPILFATDKKAACTQAKNIIDASSGRPFIFNLGHGILPFTPIENVSAVCDVIRGKTS